jgi:acyl-CoA hydrolase
VIGTPLGIGKPIPFLDAIYERAREDGSIVLEIITALTLSPPRPKTELERRLLEPIAERVDGWVEPAYLADLESDRLPENVSISEFYLRPGTLIDADAAQRAHINANYTDVVRDSLNRGINVIAQSVAADGPGRISLSSNPDVTLDLLAHFALDESATALVAVVNDRLPFVGGDAVIGRDQVDILVDGNREGPEPFPIPSDPVSLADHAVGLQAAALVPDGGTIQLGIGSMADAVAAGLILRHEDPATFRRALNRIGALERHGSLIERLGGIEPFQMGLYGCSEMLSDSLFALYEKGIIRRRAYPHEAVQRVVDAGDLDPRVSPETLHALHRAGIVGSPLGEKDLGLLDTIGLISKKCRLIDESSIELPDGSRVSTDIGAPDTAGRLVATAPGDQLRAPLIHAAFFLGTGRLYDRLRRLDPGQVDINMTGVAFTNALDRFPETKRAQRRAARFVNQAMKVAADGSVSSHTLENGRTLSGVGGQFDFVDMARRLADGRSLTLLTSTHSDESNVVPTLSHITIPGQHTDLVITEYGIADLRSKTAAETMAELVSVCDERFQGDLVDHGKQAHLDPS